MSMAMRVGVRLAGLCVVVLLGSCGAPEFVSPTADEGERMDAAVHELGNYFDTDAGAQVGGDERGDPATQQAALVFALNRVDDVSLQVHFTGLVQARIGKAVRCYPYDWEEARVDVGRDPADAPCEEVHQETLDARSWAGP